MISLSGFCVYLFIQRLETERACPLDKINGTPKGTDLLRDGEACPHLVPGAEPAACIRPKGGGREFWSQTGLYRETLGLTLSVLLGHVY